MSIGTINDIAAAFGAGTRQPVVISKASIATQAANGYSALWRATGTPAQGAIPGTVTVPTKATTGAMLNFTNATSTDRLYIGRAWANCANSGTTLFIYDRLSHVGGLSGVTTGNQNADVNAASGSLAGRCNQTTYTDVEYWWEIYTDIGTSAQTCTVTYTLVGGGTATTTFSLGGASPLNQDSRTFPIPIPVPSSGITTVSIGTTTGTAGSWGVTARKLLATIPLPLAFKTETMDWAQLGLPEVADDACLEMVLLTGTTSTGVLTGGIELITK